MPERIQDLEPSQRPRERLLGSGAGNLSNAELLAVLLRTGRRGHGAVGEAHALLADVHGLAGLARLDVRELLRRPGVGPAKAATLAAALELGRRLALADASAAERLDQPEVAGEVLVRLLRGRRTEVFGFLSLDPRHRLIGMHEVSSGTRTQAPVDPAELFRSALLDDASGILVFHNHPSGDLEPSPDDLALTRRLVAGGRTVGIAVHDHLVVAGRRHLSLRRTRPELFA